MAESQSYKHLAHQWQPEGAQSRLFGAITWSTIILVMAVSIAVSMIEVPETSRQEKAKVPERVAKFIAQQAPKIEPPKPKPAPPPPPPKPKQVEAPKAQTTVSRQAPEQAREPLTQTQAKAQTTARSSGLLALSDELATMTDTSQVDSNVRARISTAVANDAATHKIEAISGKIAQAGTSVDADAVIGEVAATAIDTRQIQTETRATAVTAALDKAATTGASDGRAGSDIGTVFNRNRAQLHSLYERERRTNSALKGKVVFALTIAPSGKVTNVKIVSSDLNHPGLEARLIARIRAFTFAPTADTQSVTVNYPVEFVPS